MTTAVQPAMRDASVIARVGFAHGTSHFFHLVLPPLFPWLMQAFGLTFTQAGALMTLFFVVSAAGQALSGFVVDRVGPWRVLVAAVSLLTASALVLAAAQSYPMLMLAAAMAGLGNAPFHPADFTLLNRKISPPRLGHAFSVHGLSGFLGWALAPLLMTSVAAWGGWRAAALAAACVGAAALAVVVGSRKALADPPPSPAPARAGGPVGSSLGFLRATPVWLCFAFFFVGTMSFGALQTYAPSVLQALYGLSVASAASGLTAFMLGGAAGTAIGGFVGSREQGHDRVIAAVLTGSALVALLIASQLPPAWSVAALMAAMGCLGGIVGPSRDLLVRRAATAHFGDRAYGRVYGFVYSGLDMGQASAPLVFGLFMDAGRPAAVLAGVALLQGLAILTALRVGSDEGRRVAADSSRA